MDTQRPQADRDAVATRTAAGLPWQPPRIEPLPRLTELTMQTGPGPPTTLF